MYTIYETPAIVLSARESGEANRIVTCFTRALGVLSVHAQGVRYAKSKLRPSLDTLALSSIALVRGREWWRLVDARTVLRLDTIFLNADKRHAYERLARLLARLSAGEELEGDAELFDIFSEGIRFFAGYSAEKQDCVRFELMLALRILHHRGYMPRTDELAPFAAESEWNADMIAAFEPHRALAHRVIVDAIQGADM
ncbi:MAG: DNA repair protein RecO [Candidatus Vogelbacteria bacterium]|nr:DNA repair protein RecO [Candidatus Vogelbacteria bacterium]